MYGAQGKTEVLGVKPVPVTMSTTNLTLTDLRSNPGICGKRRASNCLNDGTAFEAGILFNEYINT